MDDLSFLDKYAQPTKPVTDYDGFIEESASRHNVDPDLIRAVTTQESSWKPKARSNKGASGLMQLMPATARNLGVKNIYDPKENIEGGTKYLRQLLDMFGGDVNLALAGYNAGEGAVQKYGNKIPPYKETQNYVKKITSNYKGNGYRPQLDFLDKYVDAPVDAPVEAPVAEVENGLSFLDKYVGDPPPATDTPTDVTSPVPESPDTLQAQILSTFDANSPKSMTLLTNGNPANNFILSMSEARRLTRVDTPNGIVLVNAKKLNIKPSEAKEYVKKNGFAKDSGFVIDMGNNTGDGQPAVAAVDPNTGKEVFAAVTPTPESAQLQAQQNAAMFPGTVQVPTNTDEVAAMRDIGNMAEDERVNVASGIVPAQQKLAGQKRVAQKPVAQADTSSVSVSLDPNDFTVDGEKVVDIAAQQPNTSGVQMREIDSRNAKAVGGAYAEIFDIPDSIKTPEQASEYVNARLRAKYPDGTFTGANFPQGWEPGDKKIGITYDTLQGAGVNIAPDIAQKVAENNITGEARVSKRDFGYTTEAEAEKNLEQRIKEPDYAAQEMASEGLGDLLKSPQTAAKKLGWAIGNYWNSDDVPAPSDAWVKSEKDRLLKQYNPTGDPQKNSYSKAWAAEQYYQNADGLEKAIRFANQTSRSFVKNLVGGTVKSVLFIDNLLEPLGINAVLPEKAKISIRNAANVADLFVRAMQGDTDTKNWQNSDTELDKTTLFKAIKEFDKAIGDDPVLKGRLLGSGGDAFGSAMSFVAMAALMPSLKTINFWGKVRNWDTAIAGALQSAGSGYEEGKNSKLSETQAKVYGVIQGLLGTTEALGAGAELAHLLKNDGMKTIRAKLAEGILEVARHGYREGKQEFGQEVFQTTSGKVALEYLKDNDPSLIQKLTNVLDRLPKQFRDTVTNEGLIGLVTGGTLGAGTKAATITSDLESDGQVATKNKGTANIPVANADLQSNKGTQETSAVEPKSEPETDLLSNKKTEKPKVTLEPVEDIAKSDSVSPTPKTEPQAKEPLTSEPQTPIDMSPVRERAKAKAAEKLMSANKLTQVEQLPTSLAGNASLLKDKPNGGVANAHSLSDVLDTNAFREHGLGGLDVPSQRVVVKMMLDNLHDHKVREAVVKFIPVDVVNHLVRLKSPSQVLFHDKSVFPNGFAVDLKDSVSIPVDAANAAMRVMAGMGTKDIATGANGVSAFNNALPTGKARSGNESTSLESGVADLSAEVASSLDKKALELGKLNSAQITDTLDGVRHDTDPQKQSIVSNTGESEVESGSPTPSIIPQKQPKAEAVKEPWEMTRDTHRPSYIQQRHVNRQSHIDAVELTVNDKKLLNALSDNHQSTDELRKATGLSYDEFANAQVRLEMADKAVSSARQLPGYQRREQTLRLQPKQTTQQKKVEADVDAMDADFAHRNAVKKAIADGKTVPQEVLNDYPDLAKLTARRTERATNLEAAKAKVAKRVADRKEAVEARRGNAVAMTPFPGILPGGTQTAPKEAPTVPYKKALALLEKQKNATLRDTQNLHSAIADGVQPEDAVAQVIKESQAHKQARATVSKAIKSGEIQPGKQAQELYSKVYNEAVKADTKDPALRSIPETDPLQGIITDRGSYDAEKLRDVAGRIERGEYSIERLGNAGEQGRIRGGRENVTLSVVLGASEAKHQAASRRGEQGVASRSSEIRRQENILERYAREAGIWLDPKFTNRQTRVGAGGEAIVYHKDGEAFVTKVVDYRHINRGTTPLEFLDRTSLFNALFPEAPYTLEGVTRIDGKLRFVIKQPYVNGGGVQHSVFADAMADRGWKSLERESYENSLYQVFDLHEKNVMQDADGNFYVIDAVPRAKHTQDFAIVRNDRSAYNADGDIDYAEVTDTAKKVISGVHSIKRLTTAGEEGRVRSGQRGVEASIVVGTIPATDTLGGAGARKVAEEQALEKYAKHEDIWFDYNQLVNKDLTYFAQGTEAKVYRDENDPGFVTKLTPIPVVFGADSSVLRFFDDKLGIHNSLPFTAPYELVGFTRDDSGTFLTVLRQPLIQGKEITIPVAGFSKAMQSEGLLPRVGGGYQNSQFKVLDIDDHNVIQSADGKFHIIDPIVSYADDAMYQPFTVVRPDEALRSVAENERNLLVVHNLSSANVRFADKLGGLAMPSIAITNKDAKFGGFGDISLIGEKELIDPKNKVPVTDADMYSPRYPSAQIHVDDKLFKPLWEKVKQNWLDNYGERESYSLEYYVPINALKDDGLRGITRDDPFIAYALKELGVPLPESHRDLYKLARDHDEEIEEIAQNFVDEADGQMKYFKGWTNAGNKRLGNYDLETVVKQIKSEMKDGEGWNYGAGNVRSKAAKRFWSIKEIQADRNRIVSEQEMDAKKEEMNQKILELADQYKSNYKYDSERMGYYDQFTGALADGLQNRNLKRELEEYGFEGITDFSPITEYLDELRNQPTEYFEAKPQRAVGLDEFKIAAVPDDITPKTRAILEKNGLDIVEYKRGDAADRQRAVAEAVNRNREVLFKVAEPADIADIEALGKGDFKELFNDIKSDVKSDATGANILDLGTNKTIELVRTAFAYMYDTPLEGTAIPGGMYLDPSQTNDFRDALQGIADAASEAGIESKGVDTLIKNLDKAAKDGDVRVIGFDNTLPHETIHQQSRRGAIDKELSQRYSDDGLGDDPVFNKFHKKLIEIQGKASLAVAREEALAYLSSGDYARFGLTEAEATEIVAKLIESYAAKNGVESLKTFDGTQAYEAVENYYRKIESRETSNDSRSGVSGERETRPGATERERTENDTGERGETFTPGGREKLSKTPSTLRKGGIPVQERLYTSTTDAERQSFANERMDDGLDAAMKWTRDQLDTNNNNAGATGVVGVNVMVQLGKEGRIAELNKFADDLLPAYTDSAQMIQSLAVVSMFSPDTAGAYVTKVAKQNGQDVTPEQVEKALEIAKRMSEVVQADGITEHALNEAKAESERLTKDIADLTEALGLANDKNKQFKGKLSGQGRTIAALRRQIEGETKSSTRLPGAVKKHVKEITERKDDILERLKQKYGGNPILRMVAWHGSPHTFDKFDISKIGTGEGAQAYGHGLYFTDKEGVADHYKRALESRKYLAFEGNRLSDKFAVQQIEAANYAPVVQDVWNRIRKIRGWTTSLKALNKGVSEIRDDWTKQLERHQEFLRTATPEHAAKQDYQATIDFYQKKINALNEAEQKIELKGGGAKYRVDLKPEQDEYLLWDKPFSQQSEKVQKALMNKVVYSSDIRTYKESQEELDYLDKHGKLDTPEWDKHVERLRELRKEYPLTEIFAEDKEGDEIYEAIANDEDSDKREAWVEQRDWLIRNKGASHPETLAHLADNPRADKLASEKLKSLGIRGIKYLDGTSRGKGEGSYNYVIFDDADVEIQEVLRQVAEKPTELDQDAVDAATIHLSKNLGKQTPAQVKDAINVLTNGQLTKQQIDDVYAAAVSSLRIERTAMDADTKAANKLRQGHYREADKINDAKLTEWEKKLSKPDTKFVNTTVREGVENGYTDEAIWFALARKHHPNVNDALKALREEFPDADQRTIIRDSERLTQAVKSRITADIAQRQNQFTLNDEDIALIKEERRVNTHEKQKVVREANRFYSGMVKDAGEIILDTIVNFRRANLLTAVKTHFVNIGGNVGFAIGEEIARAPSTMVDLAASIFTGERTTTLSAKAIGNGLKALVSQDETLKNSKWDTPEGKERGITAAKHVLQYGGSIADMERLQHSESILSAKFENRAARWVDNYINGVFKTLGAEDAFFKVYAFRRHIEEQARAIAITERRQDKSINLKERIKELVANPTNVMQVQADRYAHFMTFQNDNALSGFIASIKRGRPGLKAGVETIMPYDRTPTNIVMRVMEYTPAGMVIAPIRWKGAQRSFDRNKPSGLKFRNELTGAVKADLAQSDDFNNLPETERRKIVEATLQKVFTREQQETFAKTIGRSSLGTGLFSLGFVMAAAGLMAGAMSFDDDDKTESTEAEKRKKAGIENGSIQTPWGRIVLPKSPPTAIMTAGATFYEQMALSKKSPLIAAVDAGVEAFGDMASELPLINSTYSVLRSLGKGKFGEFTGNIASGFVPASAMFRSLSDLTDDKERTGSGYRKGEKIKSPEQYLNYQGRGLRNTFIKGIPWLRQYADESTSGVSDIERGGIGRRIVRIIDPFNTRTEVDRQPGSVKEMIDGVVTYAKAIGTDPITAFNIMYKGERIRRVDNNTIIVERMDLEDSKKVKKDRNAQKDERLDHAMPLQLGGLNDDGNLELRPENEWAKFTPIENALGRALRSEKITKEEAQKLMRQYKDGEITESDITSFKNGVVTITAGDAKPRTDLDPKNPIGNQSAVQKLKELGSVDSLLQNNSVRYWSTDDWVAVMGTDLSEADRQRAGDALRKKADNAQKSKSLTPEELERVKSVLPDYTPKTPKARKFTDRVGGNLGDRITDFALIPPENESLYTPRLTKPPTKWTNARQSENVIDQRGGSPLDNFNRAMMEDDITAVAPVIDAFKKSRPTTAERAEAKKVIRDQINETRYVLKNRSGDRKANIETLRTLMQYQRQLP